MITDEYDIKALICKLEQAIQDKDGFLVSNIINESIMIEWNDDNIDIKPIYDNLCVEADMVMYL